MRRFAQLALPAVLVGLTFAWGRDAAIRGEIYAAYDAQPTWVWAFGGLFVGLLYWPRNSAPRLADGLVVGSCFFTLGVLFGVIPDGFRYKALDDGIHVLGRILTTYPWLSVVPAVGSGRLLVGVRVD